MLSCRRRRRRINRLILNNVSLKCSRADVLDAALHNLSSILFLSRPALMPTKSVRKISFRGVNAPLPPEAKKTRKI